MGPAKPHHVSSSAPTTGKHRSSVRPASDFPQSSSSLNTKVTPDADISVMLPVDELDREMSPSSSEMRFQRGIGYKGKYLASQLELPPSEKAVYPFYHRLSDPTQQLVDKTQAPREPSATLISDASSATTLPSPLFDSTSWLVPSYPSPGLYDTSESGEESQTLDPYDGADAFAFMESMEMTLYPSSSVSPSFIPAPNINWRLLSFHPARPNLSLHFDIAFPTHDIEYMQGFSHGIQRTPLSDADLDIPAADEELINMTINFKRNDLQWDIYVKRDKGIRVRDVFEAIYSAFDIPLTLHEKNLMPLCLRAGCEQAFRLRCNLAPVLPIVQQRQGWKRVDTLLHQTIFRGLTQSKRGEDWILNLSGTMPKAIDKGGLMSYHIAADPTERYPTRDSLWDPILELETTASHSLPTPPVSELPGEYLPPYPDKNLKALPNYSNNDLFNLPLSAAFVPRTGVDSDIVLFSRDACRMCNFARPSAILQHRTLRTLLNNIPSMITEPLSQDYTWAFFCRFAPLGALFDSPGRGALPMVQLGSDRACLVERLEANFDNPSNAMSWLHGPSGTGKTVVAYILASRCRQKNRLAGSFFFSYRHANCRNARSLVFALAYQLGLSQPQAKEKIVEALDSDPAIISPSRDLREQFARLLIEPLEAVDWRSPARVFVIDAMDQCQDQVPELISLLTRLLSHMIDVGLHIFFTSRDDMKGVLIKRHLFPMISDTALDLTGVTKDIGLFLRQSFNKIHKRHRLQCPKPWPPEEVLGRLVDRVGPHFITGSIIVKFVESLDHDPTDRMDFIDHISFNPSSPSESSMDDFYKFIISTADDPGQAYLCLTIIANLAGTMSYSQLDDLLNRGPNQKFEMRSVLSQLSPLVGTSDGQDSAVQVCHESLCDFLSNPLRCGEQLISEAVVHRLLAYSSLSVMIEELPNDSALCSNLSQLATESSSMSLRALDDAEMQSFAMYSPPEPLPFLSMLWHIMQRQDAGLQVDSRTKSALLYFCHTWQILQHLDLSAADTLPAFRFLADIESLPVLLAFPIFLAFESARSGQTLGPSTLEYDSRIETLDAVAEIVTNVYALKDQRKTDSGALDYACTHWAYHLSLAVWDDDLRSIVTAFMRQKLQQWLVRAWCFQDLETCLQTLCKVRELYLAANPSIHFDPDAQRTAVDMKVEEDAEKASWVVRSSKELKRDDEAIAEINITTRNYSSRRSDSVSVSDDRDTVRRKRRLSTEELSREDKSADSAPLKSILKRPKLAPSAWQLYFTDWIQRHQATSTRKPNVAQAAKEAGQEYANLTPEEKEPYKRRSAVLKERENAAYMKSLTPEDIQKENAFRTAQRKAGHSGKSNIKDPNIPKKPLSAYFMFLQRIRSDRALVREIFGDEQETTKQSVLAAAKWRSMTDDERKPFLAQAEQEKVEYEAARRSYEEGTTDVGTSINFSILPSNPSDESPFRALRAIQTESFSSESGSETATTDDGVSRSSLNILQNNPKKYLSRRVSTGRGGCWTCRLRRKKCDEQREDNSCSTCKRLRIDCLGWETRRPEWMRDKKALEDYKASIKSQIRGQPKLWRVPQVGAVAPAGQTVLNCPRCSEIVPPGVDFATHLIGCGAAELFTKAHTPFHYPSQPKHTGGQLESSSMSASSSPAFASQQFQGSTSGSRSPQINDFEMPMLVDSLGDATVMPVFGSTSKLDHPMSGTSEQRTS